MKHIATKSLGAFGGACVTLAPGAQRLSPV